MHEVNVFRQQESICLFAEVTISDLKISKPVWIEDYTKDDWDGLNFYVVFTIILCTLKFLRETLVTLLSELI